MNFYKPIHEGAYSSRVARRSRDPLQIPIALSFEGERPVTRILEATRDIALWLAIVFGAALGIFFVGATVPELRAPAHDQARETPVIVPAEQQVRG